MIDMNSIGCENKPIIFMHYFTGYCSTPQDKIIKARDNYGVTGTQQVQWCKCSMYAEDVCMWECMQSASEMSRHVSCVCGNVCKCLQMYVNFFWSVEWSATEVLMMQKNLKIAENMLRVFKDAKTPISAKWSNRIKWKAKQTQNIWDKLRQWT